MRLTLVIISVIMVFSLLLTGCKTKGTSGDKPDAKAKTSGTKDAAGFILADFMENGSVDIAKLKETGLESLNSYLNKLSGVSLVDLRTVNDKKAFWINAYNLFVIKILAENYPDNNSIFKIEGFMNSKSISMGGRDVTLFDISNEILRFNGETKDPRINFALFNGTKSSPPLMGKMYTAENLEAELDEQTKKFLSETNNFEIDKKSKTLKLSQIFDYFKNDFEKAGGTVEFISKFVSSDISDFLKDNKTSITIEFVNYDWNFEGFPASEMEK